MVERRAYALTDSYRAPTVRMEDFINGRESTRFGDVRPTYPIGTEMNSPGKYLPTPVIAALKEAIGEFEAWMPGFYFADALLTGPETRSTSPIRVEREENFAAVGIEGLYPVGEGAGYSGGIISSARDGVVVADFLLNNS